MPSTKEKLRTPMLNDIDASLCEGPSTMRIFTILVCLILIIPFVGLFLFPTTESTENRVLASAPSLIGKDGSINIRFLDDAGEYFADHYGLRNYLVDADARLYSALFDVSTADGVITGDDGWLYTKEALADYQGIAPYTDAQLDCLANNMGIIQAYCEDQGKNFLFTIAPNKNSVYPDHMPYYYPSDSHSMTQTLGDALSAGGVKYLDLFEALDDDKEGLYYDQDTHWTNYGSYIASERIMDCFGLPSLGIADDDFRTKRTYYGDLAKMLYPISAQPEDYWYVEGINDGSGDSADPRDGALWSLVEGESLAAGLVKTTNGLEGGDGGNSLVAYRDSFGIALIPYLALGFESVTAAWPGMSGMSTSFDYAVVQDNECNAVLFEIVQRNVPTLWQDSFIFPSPCIPRPADGLERADCADLRMEESSNGLVSLSGTVSGIDWAPGATILVRLTNAEGLDRTYRAFEFVNEDPTSRGFRAYIPADDIAGEFEASIMLGTMGA